jgi:thioredoxin 1
VKDALKTFRDDNFEAEVLRSRQPVLVDFWATWCPPCRIIAPHVEALAEEFQGRALVGKLDVDQNPTIAERYGITGIPTLLVFKNGQVVDQRVGAVPKAELVRMLEAHSAEPVRG